MVAVSYPTIHIPVISMFDLCFWCAKPLCHSSFVKNSWANALRALVLYPDLQLSHRFHLALGRHTLDGAQFCTRLLLSLGYQKMSGWSILPLGRAAFAKILRILNHDMRMKPPKNGKCTSLLACLYLHPSTKKAVEQFDRWQQMAWQDTPFFWLAPVVSLGSGSLPGSTCAWQGSPNSQINQSKGCIRNKPQSKPPTWKRNLCMHLCGQNLATATHGHRITLVISCQPVPTPIAILTRSKSLGRQWLFLLQSGPSAKRLSS